MKVYGRFKYWREGFNFEASTTARKENWNGYSFNHIRFQTDVSQILSQILSYRNVRVGRSKEGLDVATGIYIHTSALHYPSGDGNYMENAI
jgi:hypothetical protein